MKPKEKPEKVRLWTLRLDEDIDKFLRELAFRRRTSKNALVREALVEYYKIKAKAEKKK